MLEKYQTIVENLEPKTDHGIRLFKMCSHKFRFKIKILAQENTKVKELQDFAVVSYLQLISWVPKVIRISEKC